MKARLKSTLKRLLGRPDVTFQGLPVFRADSGSEWYDEAYRLVAGYSIPYWHSHYYFLWSVIADRIRRAGLKRVIDIGCGPGQFAECLFELGEIDAYAGLDFSARAVSMAERACPRGRFVVGDARMTPLHDEIDHDVVICTEVLEHVKEDFAVLSRFQPGKRCLCTVPNFPYESHVRHFTSASDVADRYQPFFESLDVLALKGYQHDNNVYFLFEGVRNHHRA